MNTIDSFFLVGMMGVGKTTVGSLLAKKIGYTFIDSDEWIISDTAQTIPEIFSSQGEVGFRDIESNAIARLTEQPNIVLSTGGGAVLREENQQNLLGRGTVIFLDLLPDKIYERIKYDTNRPLLLTPNPRESLQTIYDARQQIYRRTAHFQLLVGDRSPEEITELLFCLYNDPTNFSSSWCVPLKK